jgi:hypothetical protein
MTLPEILKQIDALQDKLLAQTIDDDAGCRELLRLMDEAILMGYDPRSRKVVS